MSTLSKDSLDSRKLIETLERLCLRIEDRFPAAGLLQAARNLLDVARETDQTIRWIERPNLPMRALSIAVIVLLLGGLAYSFSQLRLELQSLGLKGLVEFSEAALNELILLGAAIVFIVTFEARRKRKRVITAVNRLRAIAHVIDAHQLTKDPDGVTNVSTPTKHSPQRTMTAYELRRYLDYCSELQSLIGKIAFLYVQKFDDPIAADAVNSLETLTTGLSRKVWQKIMILRDVDRG